MTGIGWHSIWIKARHILLALAIACIAVVWLYSVVGAWVGLGDLVSEQRVDRVGVTNSYLIVSTDGEGPTVVGMGAIVTTGIATNPIFPNATLHGTVDDLNGAPKATVYFDWGYTPVCGTSTSSVIMTTIGAYSITFTGWAAGNTIYYRAAADTDGTYYGTVQSFESSGKAVGIVIMRGLLSVTMLACILIAIVKAGNVGVACVAFFMGIVCYIIAWRVIDVVFS